MTKQVIFAALMVGGCDSKLIALAASDYYFATDEVDILIEADDNPYTECLWIFDLRDLMSLARFFGQHRFQFATELLGGNDQ